jgi:hypothetical protein
MAVLQQHVAYGRPIAEGGIEWCSGDSFIVSADHRDLLISRRRAKRYRTTNVPGGIEFDTFPGHRDPDLAGCRTRITWTAPSDLIAAGGS